MRNVEKTIITLYMVIVILFCIGCAQSSGRNESTNDLPTIVGYVMEGIDVPEEVLTAAKTKVAELFEMEREDFPDYNYTNWRIEELKYSYAYYVTGDKAIIYTDTYKATNGMKIDIYQMNYELLTESPDKIAFTGGMNITEDNWVMPNYPNSWFLAFKDDGDKLSYLFTMMENDCSPGDEIFTNDLIRKLKENVGSLEPKLGTYRIVSSEGICKSYVVLKENNEFEFTRDIVLSYLPVGTYSVDGDRLILSVNTNESYVFTVEEDKLIFESGSANDNIVKKGSVYELSEEG